MLVESYADLKPHKYSGVIIVSNEQLSEPNRQRSETTAIDYNITNERSETILTSPMNVPKRFQHHQSTRHITVDQQP